MIRRMFRWKRPRGLALLVLGLVVLVGGGLFTAVALGLVSDSGTYSVEVPDKNTSSGLVSLGNASVEYIGSSAQNEASGTGLFDPFVRLQGSPTEKGYNTDGTTEFDTKVGKWTHAIKASAIPVVDCDGDGPGTAQCWELFVDINDNNTAKYISLTKVEIYFTGSATLSGYPFPASDATLEYQFSGEIKIHDVNQGSGRGDLRYLVPLAGIDPFDSSTYFVLYSEWGSPDAAPDGNTYASDGGFEEWKVRKAPNVSIVKTANPVGPVNAGGNIGFDITVSNTGAADATNVTISDPLPPGAGNDLDWSLNPAFSGCSITGSVGSQALSCSFATLAAGGSIGPIHITSATTAADCATVSNTATVASENDGGGSDDASVVVQCGALRILKESTKTGNPLVANAGAVFHITGPNSYAADVTDNGTGDDDSTTGAVCVSGLAPGSYTVNEKTPPSGYGAAGQSDVGVTVANGTSCPDPGASATATFTNPPLSDIQVNFRDGGSGETSATISCDNTDGTQDTTTTTGWDTTDTETGVSPATVTCTITIDP